MTSNVKSIKQKGIGLKKNWQLLLLCIPALVIYILFSYVPMSGVILAFKNYKYNLGIFGSEWNGLKNFEYLLRSSDLWRIVRNTVGYGVLFIIVGRLANIGTALLLFEIDHRKSLKFFQTCMQFPRFMSWVIVGFVTYAIFNPMYGILNQLLQIFGGERIDVYANPSYWPLILTVMHVWKGVGSGCIIYYAALMGIDGALYEAAEIDGANRWQQTLHISIPGIIPVFTIMLIMSVGEVFSGDFGLFYQIPRNVGTLYPTTDIINTYVFRALSDGNYTAGAATGLLQNTVGFVLTIIANGVVKKIAPDNAMF